MSRKLEPFAYTLQNMIARLLEKESSTVGGIPRQIIERSEPRIRPLHNSSGSRLIVAWGGFFLLMLRGYERIP